MEWGFNWQVGWWLMPDQSKAGCSKTGFSNL
jgi:hypothetical protein